MKICLSGESRCRVLAHSSPIKLDMSSSFAARLLAVPARHGGRMASVRERGAAGLPAPYANASPCPACHPEKQISKGSVINGNR
ncbi:MAG: hypothetical protein WCA63_02340 [Gallionella sp.]